jgi:hypothetical protein
LDALRCTLLFSTRGAQHAQGQKSRMMQSTVEHFAFSRLYGEQPDVRAAHLLEPLHLDVTWKLAQTR